MESSVGEITQCSQHKKRIEYLCMDSNCTNDINCCMSCVKSVHNECRDELIVEVEKVPDIFEFKPLEGMTEINDCIKEIMNKNVKDLESCLDSFNKNLSKVEKKELEESDITPEFVHMLKNNYQIKPKENATNEIQFVPIFNNNADELENARKDFEGYLSDQLDNFKESLKNLTLDIGSSMEPAKFLCHSTIEFKNMGKELLFSRTKDNNDYNYFSCIYKEPLVNNTKLTITIKGVNSSDPYLDIGLIDEDKFATFTTDPIISFASSTFSYCGTSVSSVDGTYTDSKFQAGRIVYLEYQPKKGQLKFTTNDGKVNLSSSSLSVSKKYYFFFTLYHKEASCSIKRE